MFGLQPTHILIIVIIALLFFGPSRLPELAKSIGKSMREFQGALKENSKSNTVEATKPADAATKE